MNYTAIHSMWISSRLRLLEASALRFQIFTTKLLRRSPNISLPRNMVNCLNSLRSQYIPPWWISSVDQATGHLWACPSVRVNVRFSRVVTSTLSFGCRRSQHWLYVAGQGLYYQSCQGSANYWSIPTLFKIVGIPSTASPLAHPLFPQDCRLSFHKYIWCQTRQATPRTLD